MELFIFSQDEQPLTVISEDTGLVETHYRIEVNSVPTEPFSFTVEADQPTAAHVKEENKVVFKDHEGDWRLMTIKEVDDSNDSNGPTTIATCEPTFLAELNDRMVVDRRFADQTADVALAAAVQGTRWQSSVEVELGRATTNFYYISSAEAIWETLNTWGGEFKDVVEFDEETNRIKGCYVKIIQRLGKEQGQRFEIDHNTTEIGRTVLSYPKTALYGRGSSLEVEDEDGNHTGGYTRYIDFADVEWKKSKGDPVDKPLGQKWVGDPEALDKYGILENGIKRHRDGEFSNQDYEDPEDLLKATWEALQEAKYPEVNYRLSVQLFDEKVSLGDTCQAIDRKFARPIEIQARVIAMEYDLMDIEGTMVVEMGQFLNLGDDFNDLNKKIEDIKNNPPKQQITEGSYPDRKPSTPVNLEAYGGMEVIQLYWQYADELFIKHYEVYGSRTEDFVPDTQHLLWRGDVSAFAHTVGTDEVWYYRVRAVNYHGRPSDWSVQVRAATNRVLTEDIMWGPELAERMRELHRISDIIGENGVDFDQISQEAKDLINQQARIYTDEELQATRDDIMEEMGIKTDFLDNRIADLNERADDLISRADGVDDILYDYNVRIVETERGLEFKADSLEVDQINRTVEGHTTEIELLAEGLRSKVEESFIRDAIDGIEVGGRNLLLNTSGNDKVFDFTGWNHPIGNISEYGVRELSKGGEFTFSADITTHTIGTTDITLILQIYRDDNTFVQYYGDVRLSPQETGKIIGVVDVPKDDNYDRAYLRVRHYSGSDPQSKGTYSKAQVEKGNKSTDWSQAPEDILNVQEHHWTEINQNSKKIDLQAESIIEIEGNISSAQASIEVMSEQITNRVTKTIFDDESGYLRQSIAEVGVYAWGIEQTVSSIEIGGTNLNRDSNNFSREVLSFYDGSALSKHEENVSVEEWGATDATEIRAGAGDATSLLKVLKTITDSTNTVLGETYTVSFYVKNLRDVPMSVNINGLSPRPTVDLEANEAKRVVVTGERSTNGLQLQFRSNRQTMYTHFIVWRAQVEEGNMVTPWSPAPEEIDNRMTVAESTIRQLEDDILLKVDVDSIVSEINVNREGIRLSGALIHLNGLSLIDEAIIQNAHIANGTIERAKLERAIIGTAQVENGAITNAKIASLNADKINAASLSAISANMGTVTAGRLRSSNNNMDLNLNTGNLTMRNADFTLGNGASIEFTHPGNRIYFSGNLRGTAGLGVGRSINDTLPYMFMGTASTNGSVSPMDSSNFSGFIANRLQRYWEDNIGNSVIGHKFDIRNLPVDYSWGFTFDIQGSVKNMYGINSGTYTYDLGRSNNHFRRIYVQDIRSNNGNIRFRNSSSGYTNQGFTMETTYGSDSHMHFRGTHSEDYWNLGKPGWRFSYVYLNYQPNVSSDRRLKEHIRDNALGLEFIRDIKTKTFKLINKNPNLSHEPTQYGVIAQDLEQVLLNHNVDINDISMMSKGGDGYYGVEYTQLITPAIKAIQELDAKLNEEINWQRIEYTDLKNKVTKLEDKVIEQGERIKQLEESAA